MSQTLVIELSDEVYAAIERQAAQAQTSPEKVIAISLEQHLRQGRGEQRERSQDELQAARERFERHFGAVDLGYAMGTDNETIDADLTRGYANSHEDQ